MFCCTLLYVHFSIAIILMGKRELIALLNLSSWCLLMVERLFLAVPRGCLQFVIVVFPDHTHLLFFKKKRRSNTDREGWTILEILITGACRLMKEQAVLKRKGGTILIFRMDHYRKTSEWTDSNKEEKEEHY